MEEFLENLYLDWVNNFLSISTFAEYYGISDEFALALIAEAKLKREERLKTIKGET